MDERAMLLLQLVVDDGAVEQALEGGEQLELPEDGRAVVERLGDDRAKAALQLLDAAAELVKVIVELLGGHIHDVVRHGLEGSDSGEEVRVDLLHAGGERFALGATDLDALKLVELHNRLREVEDVVAALEEGVQAQEERVVLDAPGVPADLDRRLRLVVEVGALEAATYLERDLELRGGLLRPTVVVGEKAEDFLPAQVPARLSETAGMHRQGVCA